MQKNGRAAERQTMTEEKTEARFFRLIARLDDHFAANDQSASDVARWRELKRHTVRMRNALSLVSRTLIEQRERGISLAPETGRQLEGFVRFGLG
jgi:hypothetical protein